MKVGRGLRMGQKKSMRGETQVEHKRKAGETWRQRVHEQEEAEAERKKTRKKQNTQTETERKGDMKR